MAKPPTSKPVAVGDIVKARLSADRHMIGQVVEIDDPGKVAQPKAYIVPACTVAGGAMIVAQTYGPFPFAAADLEAI